MLRFTMALMLMLSLFQAQASCSVQIDSSSGMTGQKWKKAVLLNNRTAEIPVWQGASKTANMTLQCNNGETPALRFVADRSLNSSKFGALTSGSGQTLGGFSLTLTGIGKGTGPGVRYPIGVATWSPWDKSRFQPPIIGKAVELLLNGTPDSEVALTEKNYHKTPERAQARITVSAWFDRAAIANIDGPTTVSGRVTIQVNYI